MIFRDENVVFLPGKAWKYFSFYQWFSKFHSAKEGSALLALIKNIGMPHMQEVSSLDGWVTRLLVPSIFGKKNSIKFQKILTKISFHGEKKKPYCR